MGQTFAIATAIERLDTGAFTVSEWEANFLESVMRWGCKSPKQRQVLARMTERYLHDAALAAEILGQARLFADA